MMKIHGDIIEYFQIIHNDKTARYGYIFIYLSQKYNIRKISTMRAIETKFRNTPMCRRWGKLNNCIVSIFFVRSSISYSYTIHFQSCLLLQEKISYIHNHAPKNAIQYVGVILFLYVCGLIFLFLHCIYKKNGRISCYDIYLEFMAPSVDLKDSADDEIEPSVSQEDSFNPHQGIITSIWYRKTNFIKSICNQLYYL